MNLLVAKVLRVMEAEKTFVEMDSRALFRRALRARNTLVVEVEQRHLVYDYRNRERATSLVQRLGPARVVFVEPRESRVSTVISIVHGGTLLRAAPEHLRLATRLESEENNS